MKKLLILAIALSLNAFALTACADGQTPNPSLSPEPEITEPSNPTSPERPEEDEINEMYLTINENKLKVKLSENSSVDALVEILKSSDITYTADDYGGFEKVGNIGYTLPRNDTQIDTRAGDVILYQGNNICLYYGENSWSFTRIGRIEGYTQANLRTLLCVGEGSVQVTLSLK